ncbi:hypothetical protein E6O75_ATG08526 [Venturia nashicola]|uniref:Uncharacterized protein n=1 Tax=Venturia nashicola TaxID=86259 RepID=A0A4Z1NI97_9PEZI|nr:hypothetical protein E6O75_ATG08526 [Venturia nashicola]
MSGLGLERELRETVRWSVYTGKAVDQPRTMLPEFKTSIAVGAIRKLSGANRIPRAEEDIPARQPGMRVSLGPCTAVEKLRFDGVYEFRMADCVRFTLGRVVGADEAAEDGARHEALRTADTDGHNSLAAEAMFWGRSQCGVRSGNVFVERTGSAIEEAMISCSTAADAAETRNEQ